MYWGDEKVYTLFNSNHTVGLITQVLKQYSGLSFDNNQYFSKATDLDQVEAAQSGYID